MSQWCILLSASWQLLMLFHGAKAHLLLQDFSYWVKWQSSLTATTYKPPPTQRVGKISQRPQYCLQSTQRKGLSLSNSDSEWSGKWTPCYKKQLVTRRPSFGLIPVLSICCLRVSRLNGTRQSGKRFLNFNWMATSLHSWPAIQKEKRNE